MQNSVTLPQWLDDIIFNEFDAVYEPSPNDVVYNPDQSYDFVRLYLGTYFPRSYAEAYGIVSRLLSYERYIVNLKELEELYLLDFCCGTGGEIFGTLVALQENLHNLKRIVIDSFDANEHAVCLLYHLIDKVNSSDETRIEMSVNPQCIFVESQREIQDIINYTNVQYDLVLSFKAVNEFVQKRTFDPDNAYYTVARHLCPLLKKHGAFVLADVSTQLNNNVLYYPHLMNAGLNEYLREEPQFRTVIPSSCFTHESSCSGCYMQDVFYVSHSRKTNDISKVAYRVICRTDMANNILLNSIPKSCHATNPMADKKSPYM